MSMPLCPVVLTLLAVEPRDVAGVARELARRELVAGLPAHQAAAVTVRRLQGAGLVYARGVTRSRQVFRISESGRRELAFQRCVWRALARA